LGAHSASAFRLPYPGTACLVRMQLSALATSAASRQPHLRRARRGTLSAVAAAGAVACFVPWRSAFLSASGDRGAPRAADRESVDGPEARQLRGVQHELQEQHQHRPKNSPKTVRSAVAASTSSVSTRAKAVAGAAAIASAAAVSSKRSGKEASASDDAWFPRALIAFFALVCSTNFTLIKMLEDSHSEQTVAAVRFGIAALPFLPFVPRYMDWTSIKSGVEIGLWCVLGYLAQAVGLHHTEASKGAFICSLAMVVVPVVKAFCGEKILPQLWGAVLLAVSGTAMLVGMGDVTGPNSGDMICGLTALGFGLMFVRMDHYAKEKDFDVMGCTAWQVITLAVCMTAWLVCTTGPQGAAEDVISLLSGGPEVLAVLAWVGIVTTAGVLYGETWAMEKIDGTEAGIIFASEPVWATLFASVVLGETFGATEMAGGACIILACLLTQLKPDGAKDSAVASEAKEALA